MLPKPIKFSNQNDRAPIIARELGKLDFDFVLLQESFSSAFRKTISKELKAKYPYQHTLGRSGEFQHIMNSGLTILGRHPLKVIDYYYYSRCDTADCFSSKGIYLVEATLPGNKIVQIAMTHMQAGQTRARASVRHTQLVFIKRLLARNAKPGIPQILAGDLNIDGLVGNEYQKSLDFLGMTSTPLDGPLQSTKAHDTKCVRKDNEGKVSWVDHVYLDARGTQAKVLDKRVHPVKVIYNGLPCDLSDHLPVAATISI